MKECLVLLRPYTSLVHNLLSLIVMRIFKITFTNMDKPVSCSLANWINQDPNNEISAPLAFFLG